MIDKQNLRNLINQLSDIIDLSLSESLDKNSEVLENKIIRYIQEQFPTNIVTKGTFIEVINKWYKLDTKKYKESLEFEKSGILYNLSQKNIDLTDEILKEKDELYKKFNSILLGSNYSYFDYKKNCLSEIMKILQEKNLNSIAFAKKSSPAASPFFPPTDWIFP